MRNLKLFFFAIFALSFLVVFQYPMESATSATIPDDAVDFFENRIRPILVDHCYDCHSEDESSAELRLDSRAGWKRGGQRGPAIVPGDPNASLMIRLIQHSDPKLRMPPPDSGKLTKKEIDALVKWIREGAVDPRDGTVTKPIDKKAVNHWAFQSIKKTPYPSGVHPIDHLIDKLILKNGFISTEQEGLEILARRATMDLTGLPPTQDQIRSAKSNYNNFIDQLLNSKSYGERWGRHWLDVARYSDAKDGVLMYGDARIRPFAYTYRDYVIRSFNEDKPFDDFIREQLAADQLDLPADSPSKAAMGYLTLGRMFDNNIHDVIDDQVDVVTRGMLGLTASCARCHDHKFDPIPTADYYSLYGVFASSQEPLERPRIGQATEKSGTHEAEYAKKLKEIYAVEEAHYRDALQEVRSKTPEYLIHVATTEPDYSETAIFFLSLIPGQLRPNIIHLWRTLIAKRAFPDDPIFGPWHDLMSDGKMRVDQWKSRGVDARVIQAILKANPKTPREIAETYGNLIVEVANQKNSLAKTIQRLDAEIALFKNESISLANIVGGGNGRQILKPGGGVNPATGKATQGATGFIEISNPDTLIPVPSNELIDGIFVPRSNTATITSTGIKIEDLKASSGKTWDYFKSGISSGSTENRIDGIDFSKAPNSVLAIHANKGITFDLAKIRELHKFQRAKLTGLFGNSGQSGQSLLDFAIYLDGKRVIEVNNFPAQGKGHNLDLDIPKSSRFLTLVTTEGAKGISHDQAVIGNPAILMLDRKLSEKSKENLARLKTEKSELQNRLANLPSNENDPIAQLLFGADSPAWFPKYKVKNYLSRQKKDAFNGLLGQLDAISVRHPDAIARGMILEDKETLFDPVIFQRGDPGQKGNSVPRQFFEVLSGNNRIPFPNGSGRLDLANKIANQENPLTARVWVNRVWMHHFGEPLVPDPSDFGLRTEKPVQHELLDLLASYFLESRWKTKPLHKLIMTSKAYRRTSSIGNPEQPNYAQLKKQLESDPENRLIWRANRRRMDLEQMRDSMLFTSKLLDTRMFGRPALITDKNNRRRTVYAFVERQNLPNIVQTFDFANADSSVGRRVNTTVPQQALFSMNSEFVWEQAKSIAENIDKKAEKVAQIEQLYQVIFRRAPTELETGKVVSYLETGNLTELSHTLLMTNEFLFID